MPRKQGNIIDGFNLVAPAYDITSDVVTLGFHRVWRDVFCKSVLKKLPKNGKLLDVATGTGDILFRAVASRPDIFAHGLDLSEGMLRVARQKLEKKSVFYKDKIEFKLGNALSIPYPPNSFDAVTICWSIRSLRPLHGVLREVLKVLKVGGHVFILENGLPEFRSVKSFLNKYSASVPLIGEKLTQSKVLQSLYTSSDDEYSSGSQFVAELFEAGFVRVKYENHAAGVVYIYSAQKSSRAFP